MAGFVPAVGDTFDIMNFGSPEGEFAEVQLAKLPVGLAWNDADLYADGRISVVPEPSAINLLVLSLSVVSAYRGSPQETGADVVETRLCSE